MKIEKGIPTGSSKYIINKRIKKIEQYCSFKNKTVLDVGCGDGKYTYEIAKKTNKRVVGIEIESKRLEKARTKFIRQNLIFRNEGIEKQKKNEDYDIIFLNEVLEHIPDQNKALEIIDY